MFDAGDYIWNFIVKQIESGKNEEETKKEILYMLNMKIEEKKEELMWLRKIRTMIEKEEEEEDLCWGER